MDSGKRLEKEFKSSCQNSDLWILRISDNIYQTCYGVRSQKTVADFIVVADESWLVECKATKAKCFPHDRVEIHQFEALMDFSKRGIGVIAIQLYGKGFNKLFLLDIIDWLEYVETSDRKSIPMAWLEENTVEVRKEGKFWKIPQSLLSEMNK